MVTPLGPLWRSHSLTQKDDILRFRTFPQNGFREHVIPHTRYRDGGAGRSGSGGEWEGGKQIGTPTSLRSPVELLAHMLLDCPVNNVLLCSKLTNKQTISVLFLFGEKKTEIYRKKIKRNYTHWMPLSYGLSHIFPFLWRLFSFQIQFCVCSVCVPAV